MFNIGPAELIVIFLVALLIVGPKRLPEIGRTIGKAMRELRKASDDFRQHLDFDLDDDDLPDEEPNGHGPTSSKTRPPADDPADPNP
jgi:sec-independent protein translocase protein TatB